MATSMRAAKLAGSANIPILSHHESRASATLLCPAESLRHPLRTARLSGAFCPAARQRHARRQRVAATTAERDGDSSGEGDPDLQDNLVSMLRLQIGKKHVDAFVDAEGEKLKQSVEEVTHLAAPPPVLLQAWREPIPGTVSG